MSPVNSGESSGDDFGDSGRQLTRKEIRAREKSLAGEGNSVVPPQAFETGHGLLGPDDAFPVNPDDFLVGPADAPHVPATPPWVHEAASEMSAGPPAPEMPAGPPAPEMPADPPAPEMPADPPAPEMPADPPTVQSEVLDPGTDHLLHQDLADDEDHAGYEASLRHEDIPPYTVESVHGEAHEAVHGEAHGLPDGGLINRHSQVYEPPGELHGEPGHDDYEAHHDDEAPDFEAHHDEAHHVYEDADLYAPDHHAEEPGHALMTRGSAVAAVPAKSKKVRRRRRLLALMLTLALFVTALVVGAQFLKPLLGTNAISDYPGPGTGQVNVSVEPGEGTRSVATKLTDEKVIANPDTFLRELTASGGTLAPGEFQFRQEMKNSDAVAILLGKDRGKVMYVALSAGLRIGESLQAISQGSGIPVNDLKALSDSPAQFGLPAKAKNLEGFLAPGEFRFPLGTPAKDILQKLVSTTTAELKDQGVTDPAKQYDVITVASIVQAEGGQAEYGDVAGAIYNRLKANNTETAGLIQSDATVTYGLGIKSFHIDETQKADKSNPYNTYANQGLPAGPIGSPGKTAIDAAAKPKVNEYMYWVTINLDTKETKFSKTLAEHLVYVDQYNAWCDANEGRCT